MQILCRTILIIDIKTGETAAFCTTEFLSFFNLIYGLISYGFNRKKKKEKSKIKSSKTPNVKPAWITDILRKMLFLNDPITRPEQILKHDFVWWNSLNIVNNSLLQMKPWFYWTCSESSALTMEMKHNHPASVLITVAPGGLHSKCASPLTMAAEWGLIIDAHFHCCRKLQWGKG